MDRRQTPDATSRGGTTTPSLRAPRARLTLAALAWLLGLALAASPILGSGKYSVAEIACAAIALLSLAGAVTVAPRLLALCLVALAVEYLIHQIAKGVPARATALYASGLLVLGELSSWSTTSRGEPRFDQRVTRQRAETLAAVACGAAAVAALALLGSGIDVGSALAAALIGSLGGCGLLALVFIFQHRLDRSALAGNGHLASGKRAGRSRLHREKSGG